MLHTIVWMTLAFCAGSVAAFIYMGVTEAMEASDPELDDRDDDGDPGDEQPRGEAGEPSFLQLPPMVLPRSPWLEEVKKQIAKEQSLN